MMGSSGYFGIKPRCFHSAIRVDTGCIGVCTGKAGCHMRHSFSTRNGSFSCLSLSASARERNDMPIRNRNFIHFRRPNGNIANHSTCIRSKLLRGNIGSETGIGLRHFRPSEGSDIYARRIQLNTGTTSPCAGFCMDTAFVGLCIHAAKGGCIVEGTSALSTCYLMPLASILSCDDAVKHIRLDPLVLTQTFHWLTSFQK